MSCQGHLASSDNAKRLTDGGVDRLKLIDG